MTLSTFINKVNRQQGSNWNHNFKMRLEKAK